MCAVVIAVLLVHAVKNLTNTLAATLAAAAILGLGLGGGGKWVGTEELWLQGRLALRGADLSSGLRVSFHWRVWERARV